MQSGRKSRNRREEGGDVTLGYSKGQAIYRQDDTALFWYEVVSGMVRTCHLYMDGRRQLTGFACPGEIFGVDPGRYHNSAEVVTETAWVRRVRWGATGEDDRSLGRALTSAENSILLLGHRTAASRIAAFLLDLRTRMGAGPLVPLPMTRNDIADYLGLTVETISRTFTQLSRQGCILQDEPHHVRIADVLGLHAIACGQQDNAGASHVIH